MAEAAWLWSAQPPALRAPINDAVKCVQKIRDGIAVSYLAVVTFKLETAR